MAAQDLEWGDLDVKIFRLRRRLEELGEKDEAKTDAEGGTPSVAFMKREVTRLEKKLQKVEKPQTQERRDDIAQRFAGHDNVNFLTRRALVRCVTLPETQKFFATMRKQAGSFGDPSGRVFSVEDIESAAEKCKFEFSRRALDDADPEDEVEDPAAAERGGGGKGRGRGGGKGGGRGRGAKAAKAKAKAKAANKSGEGGEDDEEEEPDLDAEQNIDYDIELDEKEMRGLIDMFESPPAPVDDDWRQRWKGPLPAGSWIADDRALLGRLAKRGIGASAELMGRLPGPGQHSFNSYITARLQHAGISIDMPIESCSTCPPLQPHQLSVSFLLHPASPIERLLVDHPTGCGKTREMIAVLDNYFHDPRPKVPIFPTDAVCRNFYVEMLRWPSKYRDFFCCEEPAMARQVAGLDPETGDWKTLRSHMWPLTSVSEADLRQICTRFRETLEMQGTFVCGKLRKCRRHQFRMKNPGEEFPFGPLRALGYTSAGGSNIKLDTLTGMPLSSLFKVGFQMPWDNVYNRKIVLMDEVHNLVRSNTRYQQQLQVLRRKLATADDCLLVGFTATPIPNEKSEGRLLLDTIKGDLHLGLFDEGFVSSFPFKPPHLFPKSYPPGVPDTPLTPAVQEQLCRNVELSGDALLSYDLHARDPDVKGRQLQVYCNMFSFGSTFHDGTLGCKAQVMARPDALAPKLMAIVREVSEPPSGERTKSLVLIARRSGYNAIVALMQRAGREATPPFNVATMENLSEFNSPENARGERFLVLIADSAECGEGISFKAVRRQFMADVPESPAAFIQYCGRANRMYGHQVLSPEERSLTTCIYTAVLPEWMHGDALSVWCYRVFGRRGAPSAEVERLARQLRSRFTEVGVKGLVDLKDKLDVFGTLKFQKMFDQMDESANNSKRVKKPKALKLNIQDVADFFEGLGLLDEAQSLRPLQGVEDENDMSGDEDASKAAKASSSKAQDGEAFNDQDAMDTDEGNNSSLPDGAEGAASEGEAKEQVDSNSSNKGESETEPKGESCSDDAKDAEQGMTMNGKESLRDVAGDVTMDPRKSIRTLARSILKLFSDNRAAVSRMVTFTKETEDQRAMKNLQKLYDEFLPALSSIRSSAVDKMVLSKEEDRELLARAVASVTDPAKRAASAAAEEEASTVDDAIISSMQRVLGQGLEAAGSGEAAPKAKAKAKGKAKAAAKKKAAAAAAEASEADPALESTETKASAKKKAAAAASTEAEPSEEAKPTKGAGKKKASAASAEAEPSQEAPASKGAGNKKKAAASAEADISLENAATPARKRARKAEA
eukprot:TRINITY_DN3176_c0_g2_i1.p1 TRINITY_DN3176_c0_g2~~TRINITY_DN3176_c0_g2_i1.p1  ORF type:complete len:1292 (-),score=332.34 TRINITY_DN3176_c0_g2_i1:386-4261(-)